MEIREQVGKEVDHLQLDSLFQAVGWKARGATKWREVLLKSSHVYSLWNHNRLVGFGRLVEDGITCMFYDIVVEPHNQGRGLGTKILNQLINQVKDKRYTSIGLFVDPKNPTVASFYKKAGFSATSHGMQLERYMATE